MIQTHRCLYFFLVLFYSAHMNAAVILKGDPDAPADQSFSFPIQNHIQNNLATNFYVGADPVIAPNRAKEFAISATQRGHDSFDAFAPQVVNLNGTPQSQNPLYDKGIAFMSLLQGELITSGGFGTHGEHVIATSADDLQTIYMLVDFLREVAKQPPAEASSEASDSTENASAQAADGYRLHMRSALNANLYSKNIPDATGHLTAGIVGLLGTQANTLACVRPNVGNFGDAGSGVAEVVLGSIQQSAVFSVIDANTGLMMPLNKAVPLDRTSDFLKIGDDLVSIDDIVDMYWDLNLHRVFIALRVQANSGADDGARAIVVARFEESDEAPAVPAPESSTSSESNPEKTEEPEAPKKTYNKVALGAIAPATAFDVVPNKIVGAIGASVEVSIQKIRTMRTSTGTFYLIVLGGNGSVQDTAEQVFAMPLVNGSADRSLNGTIAARDSVPENQYDGNPATVFLGARKRTEAAVLPDQMPTSADAAVQVGGGVVPFGSVTDLYVSRDAVFVTVLDGAGNQQPGTFYSQALFNEFGNIFAWTAWQRVGGHINQVLGGITDPGTGDTYSMIQENGEVNTVTRTDWSSGAPDGLEFLSLAFGQVLLQANGGIRGLFDLPVITPGLFDISLLVGVGHGAVVFGQTGFMDLGALIPVTGDQFKNVQLFQDGTISTTLPIGAGDPTIVGISGGVLAQISPIIAAEVAASATQGWLVCGGCRGVAILSDGAGEGWNLASGLGPNFAGITAGMSFKGVGDYRFVRKLMCDNEFLYVLTDTQLDRIDLNAENVGLGIINPITLATTYQVPGIGANGIFLDFIVSGKFALIATSGGLVRVGNNADISTAIDEASVDWTTVPVPESDGCVYKLIPLSETGRAQDFARGTGAQLYALGAYRGKERAQINRFVVHGLSNDDSISDTTILPLPDLFIKDRLSFLVNFGDLRTVFATDGSAFFHARSREHGVNARVDALPLVQSPPQSGIRFGGPRSLLVNTGIPNQSFIGAILRDSASGSWLVSGDFGLRVNE
jgi:hypothetical protein